MPMHISPKLKSRPVQALRRSLLAIACTALIAGCASTGNNFDEGKLAQIRKGQTTEPELVQSFGEPQNRSVNSEGVATLTWVYAEASVRAESFIPYAGAFMGGTRSKAKTLTVTLADGRVTGYTFSGGGSDTRGTTQSVPKS